MFALLCSRNSGKTWKIVEIDEDKKVLEDVAKKDEGKRKHLFGRLTVKEKLLHTIFDDPVAYKIVKVEPEED